MSYNRRSIALILSKATLLGLSVLLAQPLRAQTLPYHGTKASPHPLWWITQIGTGLCGEFVNTNSKNTNPALYVSTAGTGISGEFVNTNSKNANPTLYASTNGLGYAVYGESLTSVGAGVVGLSTATTPTNGSGVYGNSKLGSGVSGHSDNGVGVYGSTAAGAGAGYAGYFNGPVEVSGDLTVTGTFSNPSDARYKANITTFPDALDAVLNLRGVTFDWRQNAFPDMHFGNGRQIGFIAQEVQKVLPEVVTRDKKGYLGIEYAKIVPVMAEAIKAQQKEIQTQQREIDELKNQIKQNSGGSTSSALFFVLGGAPLLGLAFQKLRAK